MDLCVEEVLISSHEGNNTIDIVQGRWDEHGGSTITLTCEQIPLFIQMLQQAHDSLIKAQD